MMTNKRSNLKKKKRKKKSLGMVLIRTVEGKAVIAHSPNQNWRRPHRNSVDDRLRTGNREELNKLERSWDVQHLQQHSPLEWNRKPSWRRWNPDDKELPQGHEVRGGWIPNLHWTAVLLNDAKSRHVYQRTQSLDGISEGRSQRRNRKEIYTK